MKRNGQTAEEAVRIEAYLLSEKAGHPSGMESYFWNEAAIVVADRNEKPAPAKRLAVKAKSNAAVAAKPAVVAKKTTKKKP